jgi:DNA-binding MarR family transcriptional regulator
MHQLYKLGRTLIDAAQRAQGATETGMSASEFVVLRDLFLNGQSSISEIVARTDLAQSRVSICIKQLAERGWVSTATDPADGRKTLARVTQRVKDEGAQRRAMDAEDALAPLLTNCSAKDRRAITRALERLYELAVDADDETLKPGHIGATNANQRPGTVDALDGHKPDRTRRTATTRAGRMPR